MCSEELPFGSRCGFKTGERSGGNAKRLWVATVQYSTAYRRRLHLRQQLWPWPLTSFSYSKQRATSRVLGSGTSRTGIRSCFTWPVSRSKASRIRSYLANKHPSNCSGGKSKKRTSPHRARHLEVQNSSLKDRTIRFSTKNQ